jgi:general secretion pathway protein G
MPELWGIDHYPWIHAAALVGLLIAWPVLARLVGRARALWAITVSLGLVVFWAASALMNENVCLLTPRDSAQTDLEAIGQCIELYKRDHGGHPSGLQELVDRHYIKAYVATPKDPWGHEYMYQDSGDSYRVYSYGADGEPGGAGQAEDVEVLGGRAM